MSQDWHYTLQDMGIVKIESTTRTHLCLGLLVHILTACP